MGKQKRSQILGDRSNNQAKHKTTAVNILLLDVVIIMWGFSLCDNQVFNFIYVCYAWIKE